MKYRVFIDFDGTITGNDVGYELFRKFTGGRTEPIVSAYRNGRINSLECLSGECDIWNQSPPSSSKVYDFIDSQAPAPGFVDFVDFLESRRIEMTILSEGFDFYIDRILKSAGLERLPRISNRGVYQDGLIKPEFPYTGLGCAECSNCKGYHISRKTEIHDCVIFIGDGHSDAHAAAKSDIVFAKMHLKEHLSDIGRRHEDFVSFVELAERIASMFKRGVFISGTRLDICLRDERHRDNIKRLWADGEVMKFVGYPDGLGWSDEKFDNCWKAQSKKRGDIFLVLETKSGDFVGEAKLALPDKEGYCNHDLKLLPEYWGKGLAREAWIEMLAATERRWPDAVCAVTPSAENARAIGLYDSLGFRAEGEAQIWHPPDTIKNAVPVSFIRMVRR